MLSPEQINALSQFSPALVLAFTTLALGAGYYLGKRGESRIDEGQADIFKANAALVNSMRTTLDAHLHHQQQQDDLRRAEIAQRASTQTEIIGALGSHLEALQKVHERLYAQNLYTEKIDTDLGMLKDFFRQAHSDTREIVINRIVSELVPLLTAVREPSTLSVDTINQIVSPILEAIKTSKGVIHDSQIIIPVNPDTVGAIPPVADQHDLGTIGGSSSTD